MGVFPISTYIYIYMCHCPLKWPNAYLRCKIGGCGAEASQAEESCDVLGPATPGREQPSRVELSQAKAETIRAAPSRLEPSQPGTQNSIL